jgi:hypothetical protein
MVRDDPEKFLRYKRRVDVAGKKLDDLGRGSRARCAFDLRIAAGRVSDLINHMRVSTVDLTQVEGWLTGQGVE